jgi:hypothetical protein
MPESTGIPAVVAYEEENDLPGATVSSDPWHGWTAQMGAAGVPEPEIDGLTDDVELDEENQTE